MNSPEIAKDEDEIERPFFCKCGANTPAECQKHEEECDGMWGPPGLTL